MGSMEAELDRQYRIKGRVVLRKIADEHLLVPIHGPAAKGRVYPLNATAERIWSGLVAGETPAQIADNLVGLHGIDREKARQDCLACVKALMEEGLLEPT